MKQTILVVALLVGCGGEQEEAPQTRPESKATPKSEANKPEVNKVESKPLFDLNNTDHVTIEAAIRRQIDKPTGELTKADLEKLTVLYLDNDQLADVSAEGGLKQLKQLDELSLWSNQLNNVSALAELTQLKVLYLSGNQLTNVSALAELKQLKKLDLRINLELTTVELVKLQKALPNCEIIHNATK